MTILKLKHIKRLTGREDYLKTVTFNKLLRKIFIVRGEN